MSARATEGRQAAKQLAGYADLFYARGWMPGTSGNLSIKVSDDPLTIVVTPSSVDKGALTASDILLVTRRGVLRGKPGLRPSAETEIHLALYESLPTCGAVFHVHTVHSTLMATHYREAGAVAFEGLEMLKGFETLAPEATPKIPVLPNIDDLREFGRYVKRQVAQLREVPGFLIAHHGMSCWGATPTEAKKHLELMEFLCRYGWELDAPRQETGGNRRRTASHTCRASSAARSASARSIGSHSPG